MSALEIASFAAAIASLVLAIVAIVLSIVFYTMSSKLAESAKEAAKDIASSVEKLEKLFDRLYADTFSMMKDTVSDMRKHAWGEATSETPNILEEAEKKADEKIEALRDRMEKQVAEIFKGQKSTDGRVDEIRGKLREVLDKAIDSSRTVEHEVRKEAIRGHILSRIRSGTRTQRSVTAGDIVNGSEFPGHVVVSELQRMKKEKLITWGGALGPETEITLLARPNTSGE